MARAAVLALALCIAASAAKADDWPSRAVTLVVPFAAGGPLDVLARVLAPHLSETLGQQVVVENQPGGGGVPGSLRVSRAGPESHEVLLGSIGTHALTPSLHRRPAYDPVADFQPVILVADAPLVLAARKDLPATDMDSFIAYARANQKSLQYGSAGPGTSSHIGCVLLNQRIGVDVVHVPYRGGGPAMQDLVAGRIDYICTYIANSRGAVGRGQAKILATLDDISAWNALFLPKSAAPATVRALNLAANKALQIPAFAKRLEDIGLVVPPPERRTPEYLRGFVAAELARWAAPVKASGVRED
jgi:tripartite-type tricarboxylate transporter receptor subunit TctC